jgi:hypothetical protein
MPAKVEEVTEHEELDNNAPIDGEDDPSDDNPDETIGDDMIVGAAEPSSSATVAKSKKSKKKKSKSKKSGNDIPQAVVDHVVNEIRCVVRTRIALLIVF